MVKTLPVNPKARRRQLTKKSVRLSGALVLAVVTAMGSLAACSFQNFDSLQDGKGSGDGDGDGDGDGNGDGDGDDSGGSPGSGGKASGGSGASTGGDNSEGGAGGEEPIGESFLTNGSFETASTSDWTVSPSSALTDRHLFVQPPTGTVLSPDGTYQLAFWHDTDTYEATISQEMSDLEEGTYELRAYFSRGVGPTVTLFARDCSENDPEPLEIPVTDASSFTLFVIRDIEVTTDTCEVGLTVSAEPNHWVNVDHLTFSKK